MKLKKLSRITKYPDARPAILISFLVIREHFKMLPSGFSETFFTPNSR